MGKKTWEEKGKKDSVQFGEEGAEWSRKNLWVLPEGGKKNNSGEKEKSRCGATGEKKGGHAALPWRGRECTGDRRGE